MPWHSRLARYTVSMAFDKDTVRTVIFEADTPAGKAFDVTLIALILLSVGAIMLDSVDAIHQQYGDWLYLAEWLFTLIFTVEYGLRLWCIQNPALYARSFYGIVDLLGILPTYLSLWIAGSQYFLVVRVLRVLRVFRVLRMVRYVGEAELISQALLASRRKITVFVSSVLALVVLHARIHHFPAELSGGEQQRVAIARAIAKRPEVLLCDEPTGALDSATGVKVLQALREVNETLGATTFIITHNASVADMADRVIVFGDGQIRENRENATKLDPKEIAW